jgi:hypothetical protein
LAVNRRALAVGINFLVERVENLDFEAAHEHHAVVAAVIPRAFETGWPHPFDVQLHAPKILAGAEQAVA